MSTRPLQSPIKVLFVIDELHIGGTERQLFYLLRHLDRERYEPMVCCFRLKGQVSAEIEQLGVRVFFIKKRAAIDPFFVFRLIRLIRVEKIHLVHTFLTTANLWGGLAARLAGASVVVASERSVRFAEGQHKTIVHLMLRIVGNLATQIVGNAEAVCRWLIDEVGLKPDRLTCISNGIEPVNNANPQSVKILRRGLGLTENNIVVGTVGRLVPPKNIDCFLEAISLLKPVFPRLKGLIIGDGPMRKDLQRRSEELKLTESVKFLGERSDALEALCVFDTFVLSSAFEGSPNVVMEAMASGVPVVATRVGGIPELVEDGVSGLLVPSNDAQAIAAAIKTLVTNRAMAAQLAEAAQKRMATMFSVERMVDQYQELYHRLILEAPGFRKSPRQQPTTTQL